MKVFFRPSLAPWLCLPASLLLVGCGPSGPPRYTATGTILLNGSPLPAPSNPPPGTIPVQVELIPDLDDPSKLVSPDVCSYDAATGKFTTVGLDGKGVEARKYHLVVAPYGDAALTDQFKQGATHIVVEVKAPGTLDPDVIDLSKY